MAVLCSLEGVVSLCFFFISTFSQGHSEGETLRIRWLFHAGLQKVTLLNQQRLQVSEQCGCLLA